jgi:hypothetical protein
MSGLLAVPVALDALVLSADLTVVGPFADFSRLPFTTGSRDVNGDTVNLSESILAPPFLDSALPLKAGVHLHWAMPDALTVGTHTAAGTVFPAVPNRWLVVRSRVGSTGAATESRWVVESDYLYPDGQGAETGAVTIPAPPSGQPAPTAQHPYRYQGRRVPWEAWKPVDTTAEYAPTLTAVGYGEPGFAAFYPACHSLFGLLDDEVGTGPGGDPDIAGLQYDVFGWYADPSGAPSADPVAGLLAELTEHSASAGSPDPEALAAALTDRYGWSVPAAERPGLTAPLAMLAYARLRFPRPAGGSGALTDPVALTGPAPTVTVASTGVEALAAHLAQDLTGTAEDRARLEDQLVALQMSSRLADRQLDLGANFRQARHEEGFVGLTGGALWTIGPDRSDSTGRPDAVAAQQGEQVTLPTALAAALDALNRAQQAYDRANGQLSAAKSQLFADWSKYLICAYPPEGGRDDYPDIDEVRYFVHTKGLLPLDALTASTGELELQSDTAGRTVGARVAAPAPSPAPEPAGPPSLAAQVAAAVTDILAQLATLNATDPAIQASKAPYSLRVTPGPRFWQPREPVVLIVGPAAEPSPRHGQDGILDAHLVPGMSAVDVTGDGGDGLGSWLDGLAADDRGVSLWTAQPWNPVMLEWSVEVFPSSFGNDLDPTSASYGPDVLTAAYTLPLDEPDLSPMAGSTVQKSLSEYRGRCVLTPAAQLLLAGSLAAYLAEQPAGTPPDPGLTSALAQLQAPSFSCLSQALGGFNEALLMRRQELQLPLTDPLGFETDRSFAAAVQAAVGSPGSTPVSAPEPLTDFLPLRSGALRLLRLRLLDSFGRTRDIDLTRVTAPETMSLLGDTSLVGLPPRFTQPARLNLRWLAAEPDALGHDEVEMNDHPATSPICGWVLPNNLDGSVTVFDAAGALIGVLDEACHWDTLPGAPAQPVEAIGHPYLRTLVQYLIGRGPDFLADWLASIESALDSIDPENAAQHLDLALLMGRPLALVRMAVDAELLGPAAISQSWNSLRTDLRRTRRDDSGIPQVQLPIRIGEFGRLSDGLVGYWVEPSGSGGPSGDFISPQSTLGSGPGIQTAGDHPAPLQRTFGGPPVTLSMLMDPRGTVHVTTGVLPVKDIGLPPEQYSAALAAMSVSFLSTPVLTTIRAGSESIDLPVPREAGYRWTWLSRDLTGGVVRDNEPAGVAFDPAAVFPGPQELREGWLSLVPDPTPSLPESP